MSTSAATHVVRGGAHISVFQRSDGYPTWVLKHIAKVIEIVAAQASVSLDEIAERFDESHYSGYSEELRASCSSRDDDGLHLTRFDDPEKSVDGFSWNYILDFDNRDVQVWCNSSAVGDGQVDPMIYLQALYEECQNEERAMIQQSLDVIRAQGFTVNKA